MKKPNLSGLIKSIKAGTVKHGPEILTGFGIAGFWVAGALAVAATPKALDLIEKEKKRQNRALADEAERNGCDTHVEVEKLKPVDIVKTTWKCYAPAVATGVIASICLIGSDKIQAKRYTLLAAAYKLSENTFAEYRDKVVETIGEKKEKAIRDNIQKDRVDGNPSSNHGVIVTSVGNTRCYDHYAGRYFTSDIDKIKKAVNEINRIMLRDGYVSLNEFYDQLDLSGTKVGSAVGWNTDMGLVELDFSPLLDEGVPCLAIDFVKKPKYDFDKFF